MLDPRTAARVAWLMPVALAAIVWAPLIRGYFHYDDFVDLYQLRNDDAAHFLLRTYGGHLYIARNAVTAVLDTLFGPDPQFFFAFVLGIHLLNVGLLYALVLALTGSWRLAALAAAAWGTAPANEGAMGWYAVYGQVAATTCILGTAVGLARSGDATRSTWRAPLGLAALMLLGGLFFGVGIAAALMMPVVAWLLVRPGAMRWRAVGAFVAVALVLMAVYALLRALELPLYGQQRIEITAMLAGLTPSAAGAHLRVFGALVGFGLAALTLGPLLDPKTFPATLHLAAVAVVVLLLLGGLASGSPAIRRRLIACLALVAAIYGLIAIARSLFADSVGLMTLASTLRFHYAAGAPLAAAIAVALGAVAARWPAAARAGRPAFAAAALVVIWMALIGPRQPLDAHEGDRKETAQVLADIRAAISAAPPGATVEIPNRPFSSVGWLNYNSRDLFPGTAGVFVIFFPRDIVDGRRVVFTTDDGLVLQGARRGRRSATLVRELPAPPAADKETGS